MEVANRLKEVKEYYFAGKLREIEVLKKGGNQIISLAIGGPDLSPPAEIIESLCAEALNPTHHSYQSYQGNIVLRKAIAEWYKSKYFVELNPDNQILPLLGSKEGILHLCFTYLNNGDEVLIPNPGYPTYLAAVKLTGANCVFYNLLEQNNYQIDFDELKQKNLSKVKMMWVNYPHMPTGAKANEQLFEKLIAFGNKHKILICHDNPYSFIRNSKPKSIMSCPGAFETAVELNSLSKSHNMAGWRVGMLIGSAVHISNTLRFKSNMDSGMFLPTQFAASKALTLGENWHKALNDVYFEREKKAIEIADLLNCTYNKDQVGLFLWAKIPEKYVSGFDLCDKLLYEASVFLTPGGIFGSNGNSYIRISLCSPIETFNKAIDKIKTFLINQ